MNNQELLQRIRTLIHDSTGGRGIGILTTASAERRPHATWMGTIASTALDRIITMTSPDSRKARNVLENPQVEWLFTDQTMTELVYLYGRARVLNDMDCIKTAWNQMPDKSRAYFLSRDGVGITFLIIETQVESIEYHIPRENLRYTLGSTEIANLAAQARTDSP